MNLIHVSRDEMCVANGLSWPFVTTHMALNLDLCFYKLLYIDVLFGCLGLSDSSMSKKHKPLYTRLSMHRQTM